MKIKHIKRELARRATIKPIKKKKKINPLKGKPYSVFLASDYWKKVRLKVLVRDKYKCTVCSSNIRLEVHHTTYKNPFYEHCHLEDLLTLCHNCHFEYHSTCEMLK